MCGLSYAFIPAETKTSFNHFHIQFLISGDVTKRIILNHPGMNNEVSPLVCLSWVLESMY